MAISLWQKLNTKNHDQLILINECKNMLPNIVVTTTEQQDLLTNLYLTFDRHLYDLGMEKLDKNLLESSVWALLTLCLLTEKFKTQEECLAWVESLNH